MPPPPSLENLAVHPKKILQVKDHLRSMMNQNSPKILILRGMSGSGKTACLRAAANELDISINEWIEPVVINSMGLFVYVLINGKSSMRRILFCLDWLELVNKSCDSGNAALEMKSMN